MPSRPHWLIAAGVVVFCIWTFVVYGLGYKDGYREGRNAVRMEAVQLGRAEYRIVTEWFNRSPPEMKIQFFWLAEIRDIQDVVKTKEGQ